eukprot:TRINITY_DN12844_c0_g1_i2.p1 TRINITY_DN12844_c0_g1~~TRINITY_DN12844_c0_g1_i2.p1  ORF type:complete len:246 (-),score=32.67 TRINITY_DN12844_c0_g1_i2:123-860(-)
MGSVCSTEAGLREEHLRLRELLHRKYRDISLVVVHGDICDEDVDAIVNPTDPYLTNSQGLSGNIISRAGKEIHLQAREKLNENSNFSLPIGTTFVTEGGDLRAKWIIHTVCPVWLGGVSNEREAYQSCITSILKLANEQSIETICIPALSVGVFGFPRSLSAQLTISAMARFIDENEENLKIKTIKLTNLDHPTVRIFCEEFCRQLSNRIDSTQISSGRPSYQGYHGLPMTSRSKSKDKEFTFED